MPGTTGRTWTSATSSRARTRRRCPLSSSTTIGSRTSTSNDRKRENGPNVPFGQGDTPIKEVLQLIRDNRWNIQATIEFEYPVSEGSDRMTELKKSIDYCRDALA